MLGRACPYAEFSWLVFALDGDALARQGELLPQSIRYKALSPLLLLTTAVIAEESGDISSGSVPRPVVLNDWTIVSTASFRFHYCNGSAELARDAAAQAESARLRLLREWISSETSAAWLVKCDVFIHPTASSYAAATARRGVAPGYSSVTWRRGRVVGRRIDLLADGSDLVHAVLPHEISHVVFAGQFADRSPPLWVDEGLAVLAEKAAMRRAHERNLDQFLARGRWFSVHQLMHMKDYPAEDGRGLFYAQSVSLVDFLVRHKGPRKFLEFIRSAESKGYENELRRIYGFSSFAQLEERWTQHIRSGIAARQSPPAPSDRIAANPVPPFAPTP